MKQSAKDFLEYISSHCYYLSTRYKFSKTPTWSEKYAEGQLAALKYMSELCYYFLQEEKELPERFKAHIMEQMEKYPCLTDTDYKQGLYDALNDVLDEVKKRK